MREVVIKMEEESKPERVMKLTNRDLEILKFVLEMKFVSIEDVYHRFFKVKKNGELSKSDWWTRDRVYQLQKHGFLRKLSFYTEARWFYVATEKAYNLLLGKYTGLHFCDPTRKIDIHTFHHDWLVTKCRIELESRGAASHWVSEKSLKTDQSLSFGIPKKYMPDGCFLDTSRRSVAFELEISLKSRLRYVQKVKWYSKIMSKSISKQSRIFDKCLFVCKKDVVAEHLKRLTLPYRDMFEIKMLDEFGLQAAQGGH